VNQNQNQDPIPAPDADEAITASKILESRGLRVSLVQTIAAETGQSPLLIAQQTWTLAAELGQDPEVIATAYLLGAMFVALSAAPAPSVPVGPADPADPVSSDDPDHTQALDPRELFS
jgi:hypothetical protein